MPAQFHFEMEGSAVLSESALHAIESKCSETGVGQIVTDDFKISAENLSSHVIYTDTQINDVMVDGEFLLKDKKCCRVNPEEIMQKAQEAANYIIQQVDKKIEN